MDYIVSLDEFSGPLDLLLHLIKESNIDIYDIKIEDITKQYLDYIKKVEELNLSIASEYLVMAAELIEMKSRVLLPKNKSDNEDEEEVDDREDLINRLIEYQKYKEVTEKFREKEVERGKIYTKTPSKLDIKIENNNDVHMDVNLLIEAFQKYLDRKKEEKPLNTTVTKKELSVHDRCVRIRDILKTRKKVNFDELFDIVNVPYVVVTFLSILEMVKKEEVNILQDKNFDNIVISLRSEENEL